RQQERGPMIDLLQGYLGQRYHELGNVTGVPQVCNKNLYDAAFVLEDRLLGDRAVVCALESTGSGGGGGGVLALANLMARDLDESTGAVQGALPRITWRRSGQDSGEHVIARRRGARRYLLHLG